jgi:hypothetical protein
MCAQGPFGNSWYVVLFLSGRLQVQFVFQIPVLLGEHCWATKYLPPYPNIKPHLFNLYSRFLYCWENTVGPQSISPRTQISNRIVSHCCPHLEFVFQIPVLLGEHCWTTNYLPPYPNIKPYCFALLPPSWICIPDSCTVGRTLLDHKLSPPVPEYQTALFRIVAPLSNPQTISTRTQISNHIVSHCCPL